MEFLLDDDGNLSFMEMNARIQVEHPVSEMITDVDLIQEQIRVAAGEPLSVSQEDVTLSGHAIECRINAEDPDRDFAPAAGRLDTYVAARRARGRGWTPTATRAGRSRPYYDSLIAKLIVWAPDRDRAIDRMERALSEFQIDGPRRSRPRSRSTCGSWPTSASAPATSPPISLNISWRPRHRSPRR